MAVRETRPRFWSDMCPQTCTQSLYSCPPFFQRATSTLKSLNFDWEYQRPSKVSIHFIQCSLKLGWYHVVHHQINGCPKGAPLVPSPRDPLQPRDAPGRSSSGYIARLQWRIHRSRMRTVWTWQPGKAYDGWQIDQKMIKKMGIGLLWWLVDGSRGKRTTNMFFLHQQRS
jgi:hypothetical protein